MEKELLQRFDEFVDSLGDMGGHVYDLAVKQAIIDGITDLGIAFVLLLAVVATWVLRVVFLRSVNEEGPAAEEDRVVSLVMCSIISAVLAIFSVATVVTGVRQLVNPEWYALQEIARSLGLQ